MNTIPNYDAETVGRFELVRADSLRFGDLLPYFGEHVLTVSRPEGDPMIRVRFIRRLAQRRNRMGFYPGDMVTVLRAGSMRGVA